MGSFCHCRIFNCILGLYLLDVGDLPPPSPDIDKYPCELGGAKWPVLIYRIHSDLQNKLSVSQHGYEALCALLPPAPLAPLDPILPIVLQV